MPARKPDDQLHAQLRAHLGTLKLLRSLQIYEEAIDEAAKKDWSSLCLLAYLFEQEAGAREERAMARRVRKARLPRERKTLEEFDWSFPKEIPKQMILHVFDCDFVHRHENICFIGNQGTGKTHFLNALGYVACAKGINVRFTRAIDMLNALTTAQINGTLGKAIRAYTAPTLLILDELGYLPVDKRGADLLFQVVAARYESGSIALSTNRSFKHWGKILDADATLATALIDRLMHHGEAILIKGPSFRMKEKGEENTDSSE